MEHPCRRCHRRVAVSAAEYDVFEQMHYVCFHYEFEHGEFDVDEECDAGGCPSAPFVSGKRAVVETARALAIESASGAPWDNPTLHEYLEALARWIENSDGYYPRHSPQNGWKVVNDALRAATVNE